MDIFKKLKEINLPQGEYVVVGGAITAHNIRESKDLDILVTPKLYQELQKQDYKACTCKQCLETSRIMLHKDDVDILPNLMFGNYVGDTKQLIANADIIKGFPFIKLAELIQFKRELGRDKDFADIKLIEEFLNK
ncbi:MAG: hypothetical protein QG642_188 [Patescibacteria group bacterium]|nr:hypothetical protein [Patescibacteria group bacterium]